MAEVPWDDIAVSMNYLYFIWIWSSLLLLDLVFTKKNFIKAKIPTTFVFPNRPEILSHVRVAKGLSTWVAVFKSSFHTARLFHSFLAWICCNRQRLCINYDQNLICEVQLLFVLDVQSAEFFLMKKICQCLRNMRQIILNFGGNSFPYGNFTCTGETKKSLRLWGRVILIAKNTTKKSHHSVSCFRGRIF